MRDAALGASEAVVWESRMDFIWWRRGGFRPLQVLLGSLGP